MTAKRSRAAHRKGRRRKKKVSVFLPLLLIIGLCVATFFLVQGKDLSHLLPTFKQETKTSDSKHKEASSSTSETSSSTTSSEPQQENSITWEKQETPVRVPILMYHAIHHMAPGEEANASLIVDPETFESHLKALQEAGYYTLSPEEAYKVLTENVLPQGKKVVWLTFDDSLWDFYDIAYPLLKQYQMQATNFVITGTVGNEGNLSLEEMQEMKEYGMSFQGHTVSHPDLQQSSVESQTEELRQSKSYLDSQLSQDTIALAYPVGRYSEDTIMVAEQTGYKLAVTTNNDLAAADNGLLTLNRVRILPTTTAEFLLQQIATN